MSHTKKGKSHTHEYPSTPDPLAIPNHWRPEIEQTFKITGLDFSDSSCNEIVRTLFNMLFAQCIEVNQTGANVITLLEAPGEY